jgi:short-subunit dehydrogenase
VEVIIADLAEVSAANKLLTEINRRKLVVDILVNNAGFGELGRFDKIEVERQVNMVRLNVVTLMHLTRLLLPEMLKRKRGGILNVASTAAFQPGPNMAVYYATKAFVLSFSEALHEEFAFCWSFEQVAET